tara:strand:- start:2088 stop:2897 length:810 start_codon:yes stop_codon:yes gene_type:complete
MQTKATIFFILFVLNLSAYSNDMPMNFNKANDLIVSGEFKKGKKILYQILNNNPKNMQVINNIAYAEAKSGNLDKAIEILRSYIRGNDDIDIIYKNLTNLYAYQANIIYEEALSINDSESREINLLLIENFKFDNKSLVSKDMNKNLNNSLEDLYVDQQNINSFIFDWATYWQNKDYENYFNCYEENYFPKEFKSKETWKADRKRRIKNKNNIQIQIKNIKIISNYKKNILIQFTQAYNSDSFSDVVRKHTTASLIDGSIKITGEYILR